MHGAHACPCMPMRTRCMANRCQWAAMPRMHGSTSTNYFRASSQRYYAPDGRCCEPRVVTRSKCGGLCEGSQGSIPTHPEKQAADEQGVVGLHTHGSHRRHTVIRRAARDDPCL
eukprot:354901-Chlamydomonas_euryale.AAC.6